MDAYPSEYIVHDLPLVVLSGLGQPEPDSRPGDDLLLDGGYPVVSDLPPVTGERADQLLQDFHSHDGKDAAWNARAGKGNGVASGFAIRAVGRVGQAPNTRVTSHVN